MKYVEHEYSVLECPLEKSDPITDQLKSCRLLLNQSAGIWELPLSQPTWFGTKLRELMSVIGLCAGRYSSQKKPR